MVHCGGVMESDERLDSIGRMRSQAGNAPLRDLLVSLVVRNSYGDRWMGRRCLGAVSGLKELVTHSGVFVSKHAEGPKAHQPSANDSDGR
jgi:hypothetical protein